jgi:hypothetical protein
MFGMPPASWHHGGWQPQLHPKYLSSISRYQLLCCADDQPLLAAVTAAPQTAQH